MIDNNKPPIKFRISENDLMADAAVKDAYLDYITKRAAQREALRQLNESIGKLRDVLDGPVRSEGLVPEGKDWTFKVDDDHEGLLVSVWFQPRKRGRQKTAVPVRQLSMSNGTASVNVFQAFARKRTEPT